MNGGVSISTSPVTRAHIRRLAGRLWLAEVGADPIEPLSVTCPGLTVADAYSIQSVNARHRVAAGALVVGHKIGLTSRAMQEMLGVDQPDYGHLYDQIVLPSGSQLARAELIAPRIEPEIAFVLGRDLRGPDVDADQVLAATDHVLPALEVIDSRIADWKITLVDTVADNASCARAVLGGEGKSPRGLDLAASLVTLSVNGEVVDTGVGVAVLGHPARAIAWLANALAGYGVGLEAGQVILPGSMTAAVPLGSGDLVRADFGELGSVHVSCR
jgi:2-oxopent-4-enoate hydratase